MEGQPDAVIHVLAEVALKSLQLLSLEDEMPVNHINFGSTFFGTDVLHSFLIFNKSPERTSFVVILEEEGEGQEVVCISFQLIPFAIVTPYMYTLSFFSLKSRLKRFLTK